MKLIQLFVICSVLAAPLAAHAEMDFDACKPVFSACAAQGFAKDETAPAGKKIWLNCADVILNQKKAVATVDLDPKGPDATYCRDYREAKQKFDMEYAKTHKRTK